jgi:uncharacterized membrane protein
LCSLYLPSVGSLIGRTPKTRMTVRTGLNWLWKNSFVIIDLFQIYSFFVYPSVSFKNKFFLVSKIDGIVFCTLAQTLFGWINFTCFGNISCPRGGNIRLIKYFLYYDCLYIHIASETQNIKPSIMWILETNRNVNNINTLLGKIRTEANKLFAQCNTLSSILVIIRTIL